MHMLASIALSILMLTGGNANAASTDIAQIESDTIGGIEYIVTEEVQFPKAENPSTKMYMDYQTVTDTTSPNYKLLHSESVKFEDEGLITVDGFYAVALGQNFGHAGDKFFLTLHDENGYRTIPIIMADEKKYEDTVNDEGWLGTGSHVIEMIVRTEHLPKMARTMGDCNYTDTFHGEVISIRKVRKL